MEPRSAGRTNFSEDPTYLAALEAAARGSALSATSGLASLSLQPSQQQQRRGLAGPAQGSEPGAPPPPPPKDAATPPSAKGAGGAGSKADRRKAAASESSASQAAGPAAAALGRALHAPAPASAAAAAAAATAAAAAEAAAGPARSGKGAAAASGQKGSSAGAKSTGRDAAREAMPGRYAEYLSQEELQRGFKEGQLFRGKLRVNPVDRREGYVTVPGLPHDVAVRGDAAQNRALEGDEVALAPLPPAQWLALGRGRDRDRGREAGEAKGQREEELEAEMARAPANDAPWTSIKSPEAVKEWMRTFAGSRPELRITAKVVAILSPSPKREHVVGLLQLGAAPSAASASASPYQSAPAPTCYLLPLDPRLPRCVVRPAELKNLPEALWEELRAGQEGWEGGEAGSRTLMSARIAEWGSSHVCPAVTLRASLGQAGEIESETAAILEMEDIRGREGGGWEPEVLACLPPLPWSIAPEELAKRRDFRSVRVFSIDPPTAKDLDDALSIQPLDLGPGRGSGWRVGVHIADVAYFIPPFSALDVEAGRRATSVYLVQRVIPMLPPLLCEELCSLNPGVERLAFSVVWDMDAEGNILDTWFGRSVIRSCAKLSYPMVQAMIEGRFNPSDWRVSIQGEGITWEEVIGDSLTLWSIASRLRAGRYAGGALRLDGTKMCYTLDRDGNPVAAAPYVQQEANQLVEEFMLLANMSVAECISSTFRDKALLRRHPPPNQNKLKVLQDVAAAAGMPIDTASAATIQAGLATLRAAAADAAAAEAAAGQDEVAAAAANDDGEALAILLAAAEGDAAEGNGNGNGTGSGNGGGGGGRHGVGRMRRMVELLTMLATRPMQLAEYFCTGLMDDEHMWRHYALAIPAYTHFTSPIRRYPDVVVHRLLAAALEVRAGQRGAEEAAKAHRLLDTRLTGLVAEHCNEKRLTARNAQDGSLRLYLCVLLRRHPALTTGVVSNLGGDRYCGVFLPEFGHEIRIEVDELGVPVDSSWNAGAKVMTLRHSEGEGQGGQQQQMGRKKPANGNGSGRGQGVKGSGGRGFGGRGAQRGGGGGGGGSGSGAVLGMAAGDLAEWVQGLPAVRNPHGLRPVQLPLHLQLFSEVPVLLTSKMVAGQPSELYGRLYLREAEEAVAAGQARAAAVAAARAQGGREAAAAAAVAAEVAAVEGPVVRESEISWESTLND